MIKNIQSTFENLVSKEITREGIKDLMGWLGNTDFYFAPASTRYHDAFEGGLATHSLNVYYQLKRLAKFYCCEAPEESLAIVALFHDLCKVGFYKTCMRWRKDKNDRWEQYPTWVHEEDFAYGGHGSKSVFLIMNFMPLTPDEASAINCHMGAWDSTVYSNPSLVYERNILAWLLHVADEAATYLENKNQGGK